ncbi:MAG: TMEM165/GDT1 family protein [Xenococcaceae cyanobacterium]
MDWQLLGLSFITVFLAEIGDKSQLAAIALGGSSKSPRAVFFGSVTALVLASLIGVIAGGGIAQLLPARLLKAIAAIGFAFMALRILWPDSREQGTVRPASTLSAGRNREQGAGEEKDN